MLACRRIVAHCGKCTDLVARAEQLVDAFALELDDDEPGVMPEPSGTTTVDLDRGAIDGERLPR